MPTPRHHTRIPCQIHPLLCGFAAALSGSLFIYFDYWHIRFPTLDTLFGLLSIALLLYGNARVWFFAGLFFGLFWFWWIGLSFIHYRMSWAIPFAVLFIALIYATLFWIIAKTSEVFTNKLLRNRSVVQQRIPKRFTIHYSEGELQSKRSSPGGLFTLILKSLGLLSMSYIHPLSFDWFKPELMFVQSYLGIEKWQFAVILAVLVLSLYRRTLVFLPLLLLAWQPTPENVPQASERTIALVTTHTPVEEKWDRTQQTAQFHRLLQEIDRAIDANTSAVVLPETAFPVYLERIPWLYLALQNRARKINIVTGALYWEEGIPRNSTYIFHKNGAIERANKVLLVPFGEKNPLPDFLSDWVNKVFYDGAVDYKADSNITDYMLGNVRYRNAICFEATSENLYEGRPKHMIVLSNNGWFVPSIEPTLQRLLLQYYNRKYGTTIYHAVNMAPSYVIQNGHVVSEAY